MTHKQRVIASLRHEQPDRTPYEIGCTERAWAGLAAAGLGERFASEVDNAMAHLRTAPGPLEREISAEISQDQFGVQWDKSIDRDIGNVCNQVLHEPNLDLIEFPDLDAPERFAGFAETCERHADHFLQFCIGFSLFERAWTLRGMEQLMLDMVERPDFVDALLDAICDWNVAAVERACRFPIDAVHFGDDWGSQRGLLISPEMWRRFLKPRLARQYGAAKAAGKFVTIHSCGKVQEVFPDLIELGLDCFNPFQPEVMPVDEMKATFGDRLSFWGGVSTQKLLPYGTPDEVRAEVRRLKRVVGRSGGYILAPAHSIPGDARPENIIALLEAANEE